MTGIVLYSIPPSLYCAKLRVVLRYKKLDWTEVPPPGGYGSDAYKEVVPSGNIPALEHDGLLLGDSEAIAEHLEEVFPEPPLLPSDPRDRAKVRELSRFHDTRLEPELRKLFPYLKGRQPLPDEVLAAQSMALSQRLGQLGTLLGAESNDDSPLSLADCGFPMSFTWIEALKPHMGLTVTWPDRVTAWRERRAKIGALSDELASYRAALTNWLED